MLYSNSLIKRITCIILSLSLLTMLFSCGNSKEVILGDIDQVLVDMSVERLYATVHPDVNNPFIDDKNNSLEVTKENINTGFLVTVTVNGLPGYLEFPIHTGRKESNEQLKSLNIISNVSEISNDYKVVISSANEKIKKYVEQSTLIQEKERVYAELDEVQFRFADLNHEVLVRDGLGIAGALYDEYDNTVYISRGSVPSEAVILHEYFHALQMITSKGYFEDAPFFYYRFIEAMTEILTRMLEPEATALPNGSYDAYEEHFDTVYSYIGVFGSDAIYSYFYGYSNICKKVSEDELFLFMAVIEFMEVSLVDVYMPIYFSLLHKWYADIWH